MADVRALLRNERLARRINHPFAAYSSAGTLSCTVCNLRLQADSLWEPHLAGKVHRQNLQRAQSAAAQAELQPATDAESTARTDSQASNGTTQARKRKAEDEGESDVSQITDKKRKAADNETEEDAGKDGSLRKKAKPVSRKDIQDRLANGLTNDDQMDDGMDTTVASADPIVPIMDPPATNVDEDEYAAFEAAIAAAPTEDDEAPNTARNVLYAGADIAAAPMTAAELASTEADDPNVQRKGRREAELEDEKEDAARALEEEFDEMDQLEAKVKKLKDMRERLRTARLETSEAAEEDSEQDVSKPEAQEESDEEDDDDADEWGFR